MKYLKLIIVFCLIGCTPTMKLNQLSGTVYIDNVVFLSSSMLDTSYSYEFDSNTYSKRATDNTNGKFEYYIVELGDYLIVNDSLKIFPKSKLCQILPNSKRDTFYFTYEKVGLSKEMKMINLNSKSNLDDSPQNWTISQDRENFKSTNERVQKIFKLKEKKTP